MSTKFIFVETSGHTLAATLGFLGIYQEEQEEVYQQIHEVLGNDRDPVRELQVVVICHADRLITTDFRRLFFAV